MQYEQLTETNRTEYDTFIAAHPSGSFLQSWQWGEWQKQSGHEPVRIIIRANDQIVAATQVLKTRIPRMSKYYLYIPYGPLFTNEAAASFLIGQLKTNFPNALFLRIEPKQELPLIGKPTVHIQPGKTAVLNLNQSVDELLTSMHQKTRYNIKVAQKHGIVVQAEPVITPRHGLHLTEAVDLLVTTATRQNYRSHGRAYYEKLIDFFSITLNSTSNCTISVYKALLGTELLAVALMVDFGTTRTYLFGGSADSHRNAMAPYAMHWQAMQDAKSQGQAYYDLWGTETASGQTAGFVRFKLGWGGEDIAYPSPKDIIYKPLWYNLYAILRKVNRKL